jgi:hypothetical protein
MLSQEIDVREKSILGAGWSVFRKARDQGAVGALLVASAKQKSKKEKLFGGTIGYANA